VNSTGNPWDRVVREELAEPRPDLMTAIRDELEALWSDLSAARRNACRDRWSMQCDWLTGRIVILTRLAGATPWEKIQPDLLLDGTYAGILEATGAVFGQPDLDAVRAMQEAVR
jgi:hypothetical protein